MSMAVKILDLQSRLHKIQRIQDADSDDAGYSAVDCFG